VNDNKYFMVSYIVLYLCHSSPLCGPLVCSIWAWNDLAERLKWGVWEKAEHSRKV